jgi:DNA mismatch repair ATPase MutS
MKFDIDKQTINDLELFNKVKGDNSVFSLFNFTQSIGGKKRLEYIFNEPLSDIDIIRQRLHNIQYFQTIPCDFEIDKECLDFIEYYLIQQNVPNRFSFSNSIKRAIGYKIKPRNEYYIIQRGIRFVIALINDIYDYFSELSDENAPEFIVYIKQVIREKIENTSLNEALRYKNRLKLYSFEFGRFDFCFRKVEITNVREILDIIYEIDVFKSIVKAIDKHGFTLPVFSTDTNLLQLQGVFHPFLVHPVDNDFEFADNRNVCFLTGPNMAGKSTFLKSVSISVYLAHLGFPVPAKYMKTSLFNGLLTTINLSDNLNKGYSHFYSEVLRVKYIAERIYSVGNVFVVFDELFRGTNVKDAFEASLAVIEAFSKLKTGLFAISTHIIEVADKLKDNKAVFFQYFEAKLINEVPQYNYKIKEGITDERIGMYILRKEKVIETIENNNR